MSKKNFVLTAVAALGAVVGSTAANAAALAPDLSSMSSSVDTSTVVTAIIAFGVIYMGPGFAKWAVKKVGSFFG
ncbi:hypothetical protein R6138_01154 [Ralstonia thomasii]|uniref:Uncharacterized protein n=1 Tax=Ralstonia wenshanensis TaxID=2842456 RepID=A0AAD2ERL2_9RALS|nr:MULTISPECIES: hypothetical protein [Ralstonia]CAJ0702473.1 hypothetical protein LMG18091_03694 [Ralstonia wenshanensis]CAJ0865081.1 hypothetical protein R6138_01154 [Ralstonia sp. LMG 18095]